MRKLHLGLVQQLGQLETRQGQIADAIIEVKRRINILDEVTSWSMLGQEADQEFSQEEAPMEDLPQEELVQEELPQQELFREEPPQQELFQEEPSLVEPPEEKAFQEDVFRYLDTEGTDIQWVNR